MSGSRARLPNKASLAMRSELERRGIDIVEMQLQVYKKAMHKFDAILSEPDFEDIENPDGSTRREKTFKESGVGYLSVCNQAVATLARYSYPTMAAIQIQDADREVNDKVLDAVAIRETILNDPFSANVAHKTTIEDDSLPILSAGKKDE